MAQDVRNGTRRVSGVRRRAGMAGLTRLSGLAGVAGVAGVAELAALAGLAVLLAGCTTARTQRTAAAAPAQTDQQVSAIQPDGPVEAEPHDRMAAQDVQADVTQDAAAQEPVSHDKAAPAPAPTHAAAAVSSEPPAPAAPLESSPPTTDALSAPVPPPSEAAPPRPRPAAPDQPTTGQSATGRSATMPAPQGQAEPLGGGGESGAQPAEPPITQSVVPPAKPDSGYEASESAPAVSPDQEALPNGRGSAQEALPNGRGSAQESLPDGRGSDIRRGAANYPGGSAQDSPVKDPMGEALPVPARPGYLTMASNPTAASGRGEPTLDDVQRPCAWLMLDGKPGHFKTNMLQWTLDEPVSSCPKASVWVVEELVGELVDVRLVLRRLNKPGEGNVPQADPLFQYLLRSRAHTCKAGQEYPLCSSTDVFVMHNTATNEQMTDLPPLPPGHYALIGDLIGTKTTDRTVMVTYFSVGELGASEAP